MSTLTRAPRLVDIVAALCLILLSTLAVPLAAQSESEPQLPALDGALRAAIVDSITAAIDSIYVLEEPAKQIVQTLRANLDGGAYDAITDAQLFAERLFDDAQEINHDGHFSIQALPPLDPESVAERRSATPEETERMEAMRRMSNYGFREVKIHPGGVGYLRLDEFSWGPDAAAAASAAMNFLTNASAVIIDVRWNGGGSASMIRYLCGYLFEERTHLINWDVRAENLTEQSYSPDYVPGRRIPETPVYVLVSSRTFSAAEEFSFDLKNLERATLIGETTGGGGHTVSGYDFHFDGFRFRIRLPYGRAYYPPTGEGWEGVGVAPHIEADFDSSFDVAYAHALNRIAESAEDESMRFLVEWTLTEVRARIDPPAPPTVEEMKKLAGHYGPRRVAVVDGALTYQRDEGAVHVMHKLAENLFAVGELDFFRLSFEVDEHGNVTGIVGNYENGRVDGNPRDRT